MFNIKVIGSLIIIALIYYKVFIWIKEEKNKTNELLELRDYFRYIILEERDTLDNILKKNIEKIKYLQELKNEMIQLANKIKNYDLLNIEEEWDNTFKKILSKYELPQIINKNICSIGEVISGYEIEIKEEKIKNIIEDINIYIKEREKNYYQKKKYKIKIWTIISILLLIINL